MRNWMLVLLLAILSLTMLIGIKLVGEWGKPVREVCSKTTEQKEMESALVMCKGKVANFHIDQNGNPLVECL